MLSADPEKIGRKAAISGMALALFFGAWGLHRYFSRQWWLRVRPVYAPMRGWSSSNRRNFREAHQLHVSHAQRGEGVTLDEFYRTDTYARNDYNTFFGSEPLKSFSELAGACRSHSNRLMATRRM